MKDPESFTPQIEAMVRTLAVKGSPSARWLLRILLKEIDRLRKKIIKMDRDSVL